MARCAVQRFFGLALLAAAAPALAQETNNSAGDPKIIQALISLPGIFSRSEQADSPAACREVGMLWAASLMKDDNPIATHPLLDAGDRVQVRCIGAGGEDAEVLACGIGDCDPTPATLARRSSRPHTASWQP